MDSTPKQHLDEPKAPDKNNQCVQNNQKDFNRFKAVGDNDCDKTRLSSGQDSTVSSLDENGLKALLDEALAYRTPNDVQGKSALFKELLHNAETENQFVGMERPEKQYNRKLRRRQALAGKKDCEKSNTHGSLQDLAQVHNLVSSQDDSSRMHSKASKQRLGLMKGGGSHDPSMIPYKDDECPSILSNGTYTSFTNFYKLQQFISPEASIYRVIEDPSHASEKKITDDSNPEVRDDAKSIVSKPTSDDKDKNAISPESLAKEGIVEKKNVDENGNALGSNVEHKRKRRGVKAKNDKNTILSQHIQGHRSDIAQDIDALMKYIESPTRGGADKRGRSIGLSKQSSHARDKSSETLRKSRKSKDTRFQKSNSLEEVSVSKFEDLTQSEDKKQSRPDSPPSPLQKASEVDKKETQPPKVEKAIRVNQKSELPQIEREDSEPQDAEFHTVTKKQKKRKTLFFVNRNRMREQQSGYRNDYRHEYKHFYAHENKQRDGLYSFQRKKDCHRRKSTSSVPSSEKSNESSDLDSVHSLPVSTTKKRNEHHSEPRSNSSHTSYADIIKAVPAPSKVNEDSNVEESYEKNSNDPNENIEAIPSVVVSLPKKRVKSSFNLLCNPQEYPPLSNVGDSNQISPSGPNKLPNASHNPSVPNNASVTAPAISSTSNINSNNNHNNKSSDDGTEMFVEFTLVVPPKEKVVNKCVDVEETIYLKVKPCESVTVSNTTSLTASPQEDGSTKRPPVVLMSKSKERPLVGDIEFGFEINEQLLHGETETEEKSRIKETKKDSSTQSIDIKKCKDNYLTNVRNANKNADINSIVRYISSDWDYVMSGLNGDVTYFSG